MRSTLHVAFLSFGTAVLLTGQSECPSDEVEDLDNDGWSEAEGDCDDNDATVYPAAEELCDGLDNDCDGLGDTITYVDVGAEVEVETGWSWAEALSDFDRLDVQERTCVWVAAGTYLPTESGATVLTLESGQTVYGGFGGWESTLSEREGRYSETILSGDFDGDGEASSGDSSSVVVGADGGTLDGFVIERGYASSGNGGGMTTSDASMLLQNLTFQNNVAETFGAGLYADGGELTLIDVTFQNNQTIHVYDGSGAGLYANKADLSCEGCVFEDNYVEQSGAGLYVTGADAVLTNSRFEDNASGGADDFVAGNGAAVYIEGGDLTLSNVDVIGNVSEHQGGAVSAWWGASVYVMNSHFEENEADDAAAILVGFGNELVVVNSTFLKNSSDGYAGGIAHLQSSGLFHVESSSFILNDAQRSYAALLTNNGYDDTAIFNNVFWLNYSPDGIQVDANGDDLGANVQYCAFSDEAYDGEGNILLESTPFELADPDGDGLDSYYPRSGSDLEDAGSDALASTSAYTESSWWSTMTTLSTCSLDTDTIDMGRHFETSLCD